MKSSPFHPDGALTKDHAEVYIERTADDEALEHLERMDHILIVQPRQHGKTSLINHLMYHPRLKHMIFAYASVTALKPSSEELWYKELCGRILAKLREHDDISCDKWPSLPRSGIEWRDFLVKIAECAEDKKKIVIVLDDIDEKKFFEPSRFFGVLRDVNASREAEPYFKWLTFCLAGIIHPNDLMNDETFIFNSVREIHLEDFTEEQVYKLVSKGGWSDRHAVELTKHIYAWTNGQPYLTHLLCDRLRSLRSKTIPRTVDRIVEKLCQKDKNHLHFLLKQIKRDKNLIQYVERIQAGEPIEFAPIYDPLQDKLEMLGVTKLGEDGYCTIRNLIYEKVLVFPQKSSQVTRKSIEDDISKKSNLKKLIFNHRQRLQKLEEKKALLGWSAPPELDMEIVEIKAKIEDLQGELEVLERNLRHRKD